jgi:hypothetical protein
MAEQEMLHLRQLDTWRWEEHQLWLQATAGAPCQGVPAHTEAPPTIPPPAISSLADAKRPLSSEELSRLKVESWMERHRNGEALWEMLECNDEDWPQISAEGSGESVGEASDRWLSWLDGGRQTPASCEESVAQQQPPKERAEKMAGGVAEGSDLPPHLQLVQRWKAMQKIDEEIEQRSVLARERSRSWGAGTDEEAITRKRERGARPTLSLSAVSSQPRPRSPRPEQKTLEPERSGPAVPTRQPLSLMIADVPETGEVGPWLAGAPEQFPSPASQAGELRTKRWRGPGDLTEDEEAAQERGPPPPLPPLVDLGWPGPSGVGPPPVPMPGALAGAFNSLRVHDRSASLESLHALPPLHYSRSVPSFPPPPPDLPWGPTTSLQAISQLAFDAAHELERQKDLADQVGPWSGARTGRGFAPPGAGVPSSLPFPPGVTNPPRSARVPGEQQPSLLAALPNDDPVAFRRNAEPACVIRAVLDTAPTSTAQGETYLVGRNDCSGSGYWEVPRGGWQPSTSSLVGKRWADSSGPWFQ